MLDKYETIHVNYIKQTSEAVLIYSEYSESEVWIPRSLIHGADDKKIDKASEDDEIDLRVMDWFCKKNDLI